MFINVNGTTLFYERVGQGPPILLLHGNGEDHTIFDVLMQELRREYTVYALDSRGHGQSEPTEDYRYEVMAEDVFAFLQALKLNRPRLYGFSDGGIIALMVACRYPGALSKIVVSGANLTPEGLKPLFLLACRVGYVFTRSNRVKMMLEQPQISAKDLSRIRIPTLVLAGARDLIRPEHTRLIARSIPGSTLQILPGEGHGSYVIHSKKLYPAICGFLR